MVTSMFAYQIIHYYRRATTERLKENYRLSVGATSLLANARKTLFSWIHIILYLQEFSSIFDLALPDNLQEKCGTKCNVRLSSKYRQMLMRIAESLKIRFLTMKTIALENSVKSGL